MRGSCTKFDVLHFHARHDMDDCRMGRLSFFPLKAQTTQNYPLDPWTLGPLEPWTLGSESDRGWTPKSGLDVADPCRTCLIYESTTQTAVEWPKKHTPYHSTGPRFSHVNHYCTLPTTRCTNCRASQVAPTKAKSLKYHGVYSLHSSPFPFPSGSPCFALFYFRSSTSLRMLVTAVQSGVCPFTVVAGPPLCPNVIPHRGNLDPERRHPRILLDPENPLCFLHMEKHSTLLSKTAHITVTPSRLPDLQAALAVMLAFARSCCSRHNDKPRPPCR
jgi:hypothetical protein